MIVCYCFLYHRTTSLGLSEALALIFEKNDWAKRERKAEKLPQKKEFRHFIHLFFFEK